MGILHRELISRRIATTLILSIIVLCAMIFLSYFVGNIEFNKVRMQKISDPIIALATISFFCFEIIKCRIKYKYSIIADKLMIHKISANEEVVLEKIKLQDIIYIGENDSQKINYDTNCKLNIATKRKYLCSLFSRKTYCCIFKLGKDYKKVCFEPSKELIDKISRFKTRYKKAV